MWELFYFNYMRKTQYLQEKWYTFRRWEFPDGEYIDVWMGDSINDPNNEDKSKLNLNSMKTCLRLNNSTWIDSRDMRDRTGWSEIPVSEEKTAKEFWDKII